MDALWGLTPGVPIYYIEGAGQMSLRGVNWGNGFATDISLIRQYGLSGTFCEQEGAGICSSGICGYIHCPHMGHMLGFGLLLVVSAGVNSQDACRLSLLVTTHCMHLLLLALHKLQGVIVNSLCALLLQTPTHSSRHC